VFTGKLPFIESIEVRKYRPANSREYEKLLLAEVKLIETRLITLSKLTPGLLIKKTISIRVKHEFLKET
jgi:hypothetical protein